MIVTGSSLIAAVSSPLDAAGNSTAPTPSRTGTHD